MNRYGLSANLFAARPAFTARRALASREILDEGGLEQDFRHVAHSLGFSVPSHGLIEYSKDFKPVANLTCGLLMVPHGQTPSNVKLLFQNHSDGGPDQALTPRGHAMARKGAKAFLAGYGDALRGTSDRWVFYRSPLSRTGETAGHYTSILQEAGIVVPKLIEDPHLIEINAGSWHGLTVEGLASSGRVADAVAATAYRGGSFAATAVDGSGESLLDLMARSAKWVKDLQERHGSAGTNVVVFGHGTFQNSVETLLRTYPEKSPAQIFSRISGGSHLQRGEVHVLSPIRD
eukprot:TRINITY_DN8880_c0_g1_i1.p1 TRINITY_DN8880_c0_g1~~TRINITY_DN8880_c0_g1_i1.p1  ORF type:complete len:290 (-),score=31.34 TRINITY_DN8880_c0_g1_i1:156-1025(-)